MWDSVLALLSGGATGIVGTVATGVFEHLGARRRDAQELELRRLDIEMARTEAQAAERQAALAMEAAEIRAESAALQASYREAGARWSAAGEGGWIVAVDVVRGMTRPVLTVGLVVLTASIYFGTTPAEGGIRERIIATVLYGMSAALVWWFGDRRRRAPDAGGR